MSLVSVRELFPIFPKAPHLEKGLAVRGLFKFTQDT